MGAVKRPCLHNPKGGHSFLLGMVDQASTSAQRIRIGLTGLAFAFLLVALGSAVSRSGNDDNAVNAAEAADANSAPNEPLAELGVAPGGADSVANNSSDSY